MMNRKLVEVAADAAVLRKDVGFPRDCYLLR